MVADGRIVVAKDYSVRVVSLPFNTAASDGCYLLDSAVAELKLLASFVFRRRALLTQPFQTLLISSCCCCYYYRCRRVTGVI